MRIRKFVTFVPCLALAVTLALPLAGRSLTTSQSNAWLSVSSPTTEQLYGVYCTAADDCWAVGSGGTIINYDGTTWTAVESSIDFQLRSVFCPADDDCWAVGEDGKVAHYDGSIWSISAVIPSTSDLRSVFCNTVDDCWAVGVWNRITHYDGASWTSVYSPGSEWSRLTSVSCIAANDCWAISDLGYVSHYDGDHWSSSRPTTNQLEGLSCLATDDCWAVGYNCVLRHYDGDQWTTVSSPNSDHLYSVFCVASDDCWAVGDGSIIHYDGLAWSNVLDGANLRSVFCSAEDDCWAVGGDGAILHYTSARKVFLPLVTKHYPPIPYTPVLNAISNPEGDENYTVSWSAADLADSYTLQEDDNSSFSSATTAYSDSGTSWNGVGKATGTYYYRVRANNSWGSSDWSNVRSVTVQSSCIPDPPGESDNIDDALTVCSGQTVSGRVSDDDWDDVYKIVARANQLLTISMSGSGGDADLYLYPPGTTDVDTDSYVSSSENDENDEFIQHTVLEGGFWYIDVYCYEGTTQYRVTATLSDAGASETKNFSIQTGQVRDRHQGKVPGAPRYSR